MQMGIYIVEILSGQLWLLEKPASKQGVRLGFLHRWSMYKESHPSPQ